MGCLEKYLADYVSITIAKSNDMYSILLLVCIDYLYANFEATNLP